jgi:hypothetical protein
MTTMHTHTHTPKGSFMIITTINKIIIIKNNDINLRTY